jgi:hypothetical protein
MIRRLLLGLVVLVSATRCRRDNTLETPINQHCSELYAELDSMAQDYEARSKLSDAELSTEQQQNADRKYGIIAMDRRSSSVRVLGRELMFCEVVRKLDDQAFRALDRRTATALEAYATSAKLADSAKALHDLSALALEVSHLPLK